MELCADNTPTGCPEFVGLWMNILAEVFVEDDLFCYPDIAPARVSDVTWNENALTQSDLSQQKNPVFHASPSLHGRPCSELHTCLPSKAWALTLYLLVTIRTRFADLNFVDKDDVGRPFSLAVIDRFSTTSQFCHRFLVASFRRARRRVI